MGHGQNWPYNKNIRKLKWCQNIPPYLLHFLAIKDEDFCLTRTHSHWSQGQPKNCENRTSINGCRGRCLSPKTILRESGGKELDVKHDQVNQTSCGGFSEMQITSKRPNFKMKNNFRIFLWAKTSARHRLNSETRGGFCFSLWMHNFTPRGKHANSKIQNLELCGKK